MRKRNVKVEESDLDEEIARAAELYGYTKPDGTPDIDAWLKYVTKDDASTIELYVRDAVWPSVALKKLVDSEVVITEEDLKKGFEANFGERVEALAIVCTNQRQAAKVRIFAKRLPRPVKMPRLADGELVISISRLIEQRGTQCRHHKQRAGEAKDVLKPAVRQIQPRSHQPPGESNRQHRADSCRNQHRPSAMRDAHQFTL